MEKKVKIEKNVEIPAKDFLERIANEIGDAEMIMLPSQRHPQTSSDKITEKNINFPMRNTTEEQKDNWEALTRSIKGHHAERFNDILNELSVSKPLEFLRVYLKALEFVAPKLIRTDGSEAEIKDNEIVITIKK